jgi:hypothetical protein
MLVDSIEAASRTIFPPELKKFEEMIQRVIFTKLSAGQLDESGLMLEDLRIITSRMASTLVNMYHGRIKYPWQKEAERAQAHAGLDRTTAVPPVPVSMGDAPKPLAANGEPEKAPLEEAKTEAKAEAKPETAEAKPEAKAETKAETKAELAARTPQA